MSKKNTWLILGLAIIASLTLVGFATAHGWGAMSTQGSFMMHSQNNMEQLIEEGTYQDLVEYREQTGFTMMPWVDSQEEFEAMQEHHEEMEKWHEEIANQNGFDVSSFGRGFGGCGMYR